MSGSLHLQPLMLLLQLCRILAGGPNLPVHPISSTSASQLKEQYFCHPQSSFYSDLTKKKCSIRNESIVKKQWAYLNQIVSTLDSGQSEVSERKHFKILPLNKHYEILWYYEILLHGQWKHHLKHTTSINSHSPFQRPPCKKAQINWGGGGKWQLSWSRDQIWSAFWCLGVWLGSCITDFTECWAKYRTCQLQMNFKV